MKNIIFNPSKEKFSAIDFSQIKINEYISTAKKAIEIAQKRIDSIKKEEVPLFENTIEALERSAKELDDVQSIFYNLLNTCGDDSMHKIAPEISLIISNFNSSLILDTELFEKIKTIYNKENKNLNLEQKKLLEETYSNFVRNGVSLNKEKKDRLKQVNGELSRLNPKFSENVLKATNEFELHVKNKDHLEGLPEGSLQAAEELAKEANKEGWIFNLQYPSFGPFMKFCQERSLREKMYLAFTTRSTNGPYNNKKNILEIISLRHEKAQLLGYSNYAEFLLKKRMAKNTDTVRSFLNELLKPSLKAAKKELKELQDFAIKHNGPDELKPWDIGFYQRKLKEEMYSFNEEDLRPYFLLENCIQGMFKHAELLYELKFIPSENVPKYHKDVKIYEVYTKSEKFIGLFYADFFPRKVKSGGAWASRFKDQFNQEKNRPHVSIVCNFTKPTNNKPSLLTFNEVRTLFHEFGHALHSLLSQCQYSSLSGTNVYWDFVELPSQMLENWTLEKESLDLFAIHYKTKEKMPKELTEKIKKSSQFMTGLASLRQIGLANLDMDWHTTDPSTITSVEEFEVQSQKSTRLLPHIDGTSTSCSFSHIFDGGYAAGYYSYKWAEVLDADAFELFKKNGIFNSETAQSFKVNILEKGGTEHPLELYKKFRGREPNSNALLKREGWLKQ